MWSGVRGEFSPRRQNFKNQTNEKRKEADLTLTILSYDLVESKKTCYSLHKRLYPDIILLCVDVSHLAVSLKVISDEIKIPGVCHHLKPKVFISVEPIYAEVG
jgi:hypothetical protein